MLKYDIATTHRVLAATKASRLSGGSFRRHDDIEISYAEGAYAIKCRACGARWRAVEELPGFDGINFERLTEESGVCQRPKR